MTNSRRRSARTAFVAAAFLAIAPALALHAQQRRSGNGAWRTAWATSQQTLGTTAYTNATMRLVARTTIGGDALRVRLDNTFGTAPLVIGRAAVGLRARGAALVRGSNQPLLFAGAPTVTIPPGGTVRSDPVNLVVLGRQDVLVSLYVPGPAAQASQHTGALVTSYAAPNGGDVTTAESAERFTITLTTMPWLKALEVRSSSSGTIVAFGDSITDGTCGTLDAHDRWEDWLAVRLALADGRHGGREIYKAVVNEGIGGNTVTREGLQPPPDSTPGLERLERDVLSHEGVTDAVLFMGTNDIRRGAPAAQLIGGMTEIARRIKAQGIKVFGATIIPRHNVAATGTNSGWNDAKTAVRREVNQWIRARGSFDGVLDFDAVVRDPANADMILPAFDCDGIHPTPRGYLEMGRSIGLEMFGR
jgi:lysophospholipase L1-like esterase